MSFKLRTKEEEVVVVDWMLRAQGTNYFSRFLEGLLEEWWWKRSPPFQNEKWFLTWKITSVISLAALSLSLSGYVKEGESEREKWRTPMSRFTGKREL